MLHLLLLTYVFVIQGGVMLVSHDESLIRLTCKELWVCANGEVTSMEGGLDEYKRIVEAEFAAQK